jgi:hypothetical protein
MKDMMPSILAYYTSNHYCYDFCSYLSAMINNEIEGMRKLPEGFYEYL